MPHYEILELPGKERIHPEEGEQPARTQEEAKIIMQRLRAEAKVEGRQVDFLIRPMNAGARGSVNGSGGAATSVRLTEENRAKVARFCGRMMMHSGEPMTMGDAVAKLIDHYDRTAHLIDTDTGEISDDAIITHAKVVMALRKAERRAAEAEEGAA